MDSLTNLLEMLKTYLIEGNRIIVGIQMFFGFMIVYGVLKGFNVPHKLRMLWRAYWGSKRKPVSRFDARFNVNHHPRNLSPTADHGQKHVRPVPVVYPDSYTDGRS